MFFTQFSNHECIPGKAKETSDLAQIGEVSPADALVQIHADITPILAKNK